MGTTRALTVGSCAALLLQTAASVCAGTPFQDSFDSYPCGSFPVGWQERYTGPGGSPEYTRDQAAILGITIRVVEGPSVCGSSLQLLDASTGWATGVSSKISRTLTPESSVVLEYCIRSDNAAYEAAFVGLSGDAGTDHSVGFGGSGGGGQAGYIGIIAWSHGWVKPDLLPYTEDTWYYVRRSLDCATGQGAFYVEEFGNPGNSASYSVGSDYANTYVDEIWMVTSGSQGADCYVDSLSIGPPPASGDANGDSVVDMFDLAILACNYGLSGGADWAHGDFDDDDDVDVVDLAILANNYGWDGTSAAGPVPEPAALALLAPASLALLRRRKR